MRVVSTENEDTVVRDINVQDAEDLKDKEREAEIFAKSKHIVKDHIETVGTRPVSSITDLASNSETDLNQYEDKNESSADDNDDQVGAQDESPWNIE